MAKINIFRQDQTRKSDNFDDSIPAGQTDLETNSVDLESDLNSIRSQINRILDATGLSNWFNDIPIVNSKKRSLLQLNTDLDTLEKIQDQLDSFVPTLGQTVFVLTEIPIDPNKPFVELNGQDLKAGLSFSVSGTLLTITLPYQLTNKDDLVAKYKFTE